MPVLHLDKLSAFSWTSHALKCKLLLLWANLKLLVFQKLIILEQKKFLRVLLLLVQRTLNINCSKSELLLCWSSGISGCSWMWHSLHNAREWHRPSIITSLQGPLLSPHKQHCQSTLCGTRRHHRRLRHVPIPALPPCISPPPRCYSLQLPASYIHS